MKHRFLPLLPFSLVLASALPPLRGQDRDRLAALFEAVREEGGVVTIPPGDYRLGEGPPIALPSRTTVLAHGARFHFPETLGDQARVVLFSGTDLRDFAWHGGEFHGRVFDPDRRENSWEPNASARAIEVLTTEPGGTRDLLFRDLRAEGVGGAVVGVHGLARRGSESEVEAYAERISLEGCVFLRCGKFMWDYGHLWQILTWPEDYEEWEVERARRYFRIDLVKAPLVLADGDERVRFDNSIKPVTRSEGSEPSQAISFLAGKLPENLVRGRQYFVVEAGPDFVRLSETPDGEAIRFRGEGGEGLSLVHNLQAAFWALYAPTGAGPGKGAFDITSARGVRVVGGTFSALGDTMHIQRCRDIVFANNHILGSRMGAFFLAEHCRNASVTGNLVDGTNGSRVMSVEKSCEDVAIVGNTFRNGGRGSWINQPRNFVLVGNVFVDNTTKGTDDPRRGRRSYETGAPRRFPELYFTLHEREGGYGPVVVRDNVFQLGDTAPDEAVTFAPNGESLQMSGNAFPGRAVSIVVDPSCRGVEVRDNPGAETVRAPVDFNHGRR